MPTRLAILLRGFAMAALVSAVFAVPVRAGDFAERNMIGFSADGRYFAFEQFGIQDGSGFPYSEIFVVDLDEDEWVSGTPVRIRLDDETAALTTARNTARRRVASLIADLGIHHPGRLIAAAPATELPDSSHEHRFRLYPFASSTATVHTVELDVFTLDPPADCAPLGIEIKGFEIAISGDNGPETAYRDTSVPASRRCPLDYGLSDIIAFPAFERAQRLVALVNVLSYGFEGADRRFLVIPLPLP